MYDKRPVEMSSRRNVRPPERLVKPKPYKQNTPDFLLWYQSLYICISCIIRDGRDCELSLNYALCDININTMRVWE